MSDEDELDRLFEELGLEEDTEDYMQTRLSEFQKVHQQPKMVVCNINYADALAKQDIAGTTALQEYINHGHKINDVLRGHYMGDIRDVYARLIKHAQPLNKLTTCPGDSYFVVYRSMNAKYDEQQSLGFMSTSSEFIRQWGDYHMKIFVPSTTRVLIKDISKLLGTETEVYEVLLQPNTQLELLNVEDGLHVYKVKFSQSGGNERVPHFYINPVSGRVIKSSGKMFKNLKSKRYKLKQDACLYDITSARRCLDSILSKYGGRVYPSSTFIDIPSTYHKNVSNTKYKARAFIKTFDKKKIKGYIDKQGILYNVQPPIIFPNADIPEILYLPQHQDALHDKLDHSVLASQDSIAEIRTQLQSKPISENISIVYNPLQNDFIPVSGKVVQHQHEAILKDFNDTLVPTDLPTVKNTSIAGIISNTDNRINGYTNESNKSIQFATPIKVKQDVVDFIPKVLIDQKGLSSLQIATDEEKARFAQDLKSICADGEQYEMSVKQCYPCDFYNLVWDISSRKCKLKEKSEVSIVEDTDGKIVGYIDN